LKRAGKGIAGHEYRDVLAPCQAPRARDLPRKAGRPDHDALPAGLGPGPALGAKQHWAIARRPGRVERVDLRRALLEVELGIPLGAAFESHARARLEQQLDRQPAIGDVEDRQRHVDAIAHGELRGPGGFEVEGNPGREIDCGSADPPVFAYGIDEDAVAARPLRETDALGRLALGVAAQQRTPEQGLQGMIGRRGLRGCGAVRVVRRSEGGQRSRWSSGCRGRGRRGFFRLRPQLEGNERDRGAVIRLEPLGVHEHGADHDAHRGHAERRGPQAQPARDVQQAEHGHEHHQADAAEEAQGGQGVEHAGAIHAVGGQALLVATQELAEVVEQERGRDVRAWGRGDGGLRRPRRTRLGRGSICCFARFAPDARAEEQVEGDRRFRIIGQIGLDVVDVRAVVQLSQQHELAHGGRRGGRGCAWVGQARDADAQQGRRGVALLVGDAERELGVVAGGMESGLWQDLHVQSLLRAAVDEPLGQQLGGAGTIGVDAQADHARRRVVQGNRDRVGPLVGHEGGVGDQDPAARDDGHQRQSGRSGPDVELQRLAGLQHAQAGGQHHGVVGDDGRQFEVILTVGGGFDAQPVLLAGLGMELERAHAGLVRLDGRRDAALAVDDGPCQADRLALSIAGRHVEAVLNARDQLAAFRVEAELRVAEMKRDLAHRRLAQRAVFQQEVESGVALADLIGQREPDAEQSSGRRLAGALVDGLGVEGDQGLPAGLGRGLAVRAKAARVGHDAVAGVVAIAVEFQVHLDSLGAIGTDEELAPGLGKPPLRADRHEGIDAVGQIATKRELPASHSADRPALTHRTWHQRVARRADLKPDGQVPLHRQGASREGERAKADRLAGPVERLVETDCRQAAHGRDRQGGLDALGSGRVDADHLHADLVGEIRLGGHGDLDEPLLVGGFLVGHQGPPVRGREGEFHVGRHGVAGHAGGPHQEAVGHAEVQARGAAEHHTEVLGGDLGQLAALVEVSAQRDEQEHAGRNAHDPVGPSAPGRAARIAGPGKPLGAGRWRDTLR